MLSLLIEKSQELITIKVLLVSLLGLFVFLIHSITLHQYLRNRSFIVTSMILPVVALVITTVISTNIVLSLGMIGALSIIRYRTPVKSIYELSLLFALITIGIAGGVNIKYSIGLAIFISLIGVATFIMSKFFPNIFLKDYSYDQKYIEVSFKINGPFEKVNKLNNINKWIVSYDEDLENNNTTTFYLRFNNLDEVNKFKEQLFKLENLKILNFSLSNR